MKLAIKHSTISIIFILVFLSSCGIFKYSPVDTRKVPVNAQERARKNIEEGKGISVKNLLGSKGGSFEFSNSNPLWRASLEIIDFIPLTTVDYSGGIIISDWYNDINSKDSIKITIRFLSTEISASSIKIIVHKKICKSERDCNISEIKSKINDELLTSILKKASILEANKKK